MYPRILQLIVIILLAEVCHGERERCIVFNAFYWETQRMGDGNYIDVGSVDVNNNFHLEMHIMPTAVNHDGILFSASNTHQFHFFDRSPEIQYVVLEISFSTLQLTVKDMNGVYFTSFEVPNSPHQYNLANIRWHNVKAWRSPGFWHIEVDSIEMRNAIDRTLETSTDVIINQAEAYIGGRPGYSARQYRGIIKSVKINHRPIELSTAPVTNSIADEYAVMLLGCKSRVMRQFISEMRIEMAANFNRPVPEFAPWETEAAATRRPRIHPLPLPIQPPSVSNLPWGGRR